MIFRTRMNDIYSQLTKSLNNSLISHNILLEMPSYNATLSAYNGIKYTIESIIKANDNLKITEYTDDGDSKIICITREKIAYNTNINIYISKNEEKKQILFEVYINML